MRLACEEIVRGQEYVQQEVPLSWIKALDRLHQNDTGRIDLEEAKAILRREGVDDKREADAALKFFHELGLIIHFKKTETLRNVVTTNPQWLVDELSKLIRDSEDFIVSEDEINERNLHGELNTLKKRGIASIDLLERLWDEDQVRFLIDLMESLLLVGRWKFGNAQDELYLVPCMTSTLEDAVLSNPEIADEFSAAELRPNFCVAFTYLPDGVFERIECMCIDRNYSKGVKISPPKMFRNAAKFWLNAEVYVVLLVKGNAITVTLAHGTEKDEHDVIQEINTILNKLQRELFTGPFKWEIEQFMEY